MQKLAAYPVFKLPHTFGCSHPDGYVYEFGQTQINESYVESTNVFGNASSSLFTPSTVTWYLTKVSSPTGKKIDFLYNTLTQKHTCSNYSETFQKIVTTGSQALVGTGIITAYGYPNGPISSGGVFSSFGKSREYKTYIAQIQSEDEVLFFNRDTRQDAVNSSRLMSINIQGNIFSKTQNPTYGWASKRLLLHHDYFTSSTAFKGYTSTGNDDVMSLRLRLTAVEEENAGSYRFTYNTEPLPPRNAFAQDYWGFYNGSTSNTSLIPNPARLRNVVFTENNGNNNSAQLQYAQAGSLRTITYPTGGTKKLLYELNTFDNYWVPDYSVSDPNNLAASNTRSQGNGLRIRSIQNYTGTGKLSAEERYEYQGGKALLPISFVRRIKYDYISIVQNPPTPGDAPANATYCDLFEVKTSGQFTPSLTGSGTGVGYSMVTQVRSGMAAGARITYFRNFADDNSTGDNPAVRLPSSTLRALSIGLPAFANWNDPKTGDIDSVVYVDAAQQRVRKTSYTYQVLNSRIHYGARISSAGLLFGRQQVLGGSGGYEWVMFARNLTGFYPIYCKRSRKTSETTVEFSPTVKTPFSTTTTFNYDLYERVVQLIKQTPLTLEKTALYYPNNTSDPSFEQQLFTQNRLSEVMRYEFWRNEQNPGYPTYRYTKEYQFHPSGPVVKQVTIQERMSGATASKDHAIRFDAYDLRGRVLQATRSSAPPTAYIWHDTRDALLAEVQNATPDRVAYTSFEFSAPGKWEYNTDPSLALVGGVAGKQCYELTNRVRTANLPAGSYTLTYWAKNGSPIVQFPGSPAFEKISTPRLLAERPDGWKQYQVTTSFTTNALALEFPSGQAGIFLDEVRLYPAGAMMSTFVDEPLNGITATGDPSGRLTMYEYDAAIRLKRIRDEKTRILTESDYHIANP